MRVEAGFRFREALRRELALRLRLLLPLASYLLPFTSYLRQQRSPRRKRQQIVSRQIHHR